MRDIWQTDDLEGISNPKPLNSFAITRLLNRAWQVQKIRPSLPKGVKRHEFKTAHGFRKYHKTQMEQARVPSIKIELLLGHSIGVSDSYARFSEKEMLDDFLLGVDYLTVNQTVVLINKSLKKQEEIIQNSLREMEERHRKEIFTLREKYELDMKMLQEKIELRFEKLIDKVDVNKLTK